MPAEHVVVRERVAEEVRALEPAAHRLLLVVVAHERGHARDVGVHRVADRHALVRRACVVVVDPVPRLFGIDERERERADRLAARRGGWSRAGCTRPTPAGAASARGLGTTLRGGIVTYSPAWPVNGVSVMQRSATRRPSSHIARLSLGSIPKPPSSASDDDSPVPKSARPPDTRSSIATRSATARGMVERRRRLHDAVTETDALRALRHRGEEHLGRAASGCTPRGSGAPPPRRSRCRARSASSICSSASWIRRSRSRRPTAAGAGARRRSRTSSQHATS